MNWRRALIPAAAVATALAVPQMLSAQGVRLIPQLGLYAPVADIGRVPGVSGAVDIGRKESTLALGASIELGGAPVSFRANGMYAAESDVPLSGVGCQGCGASRSTLLALTGSVVFRPIPRLVLVQPYVLAGAGVKRYDFDFGASSAGDLVDDQSRLAGHFGLGTEIDLAGFRAVVEISDFVSRLEIGPDGEKETQNDVFFTVGIVLGGR